MDARAVDSATVRVSWTLKQHPRARVYMGVDVEYREMSDTGEVVGQRIQRYYGTGNTMLLGSLNSGTTYEVQVLARTGTDDYVPSRTVTVSTDPEFPEPPFNLRTTSISHSEIEIAWDTRTPLERLSGFSVFVLDVESGVETLHRLETAVSNSLTIPNLQENSEYEISVSSWIRGDQGNRSEPLAVRTDHFAPDAPPYVKGNSINATALEVTWGLPENRYARSYIIGHHIKYENLVPSQSDTSKTVSVSDGTQVVLTSLQENKTYKIQVRAFTAHNQGQWSQPIRLKTMVSPQPEDLTPILVSHDSIHLTWDAPIILRDIKSFNIYVRDTMKGRQTKTKVPAEKEFTITGLLPDTRYTIKVSSNYNSRESDISEPLNVVTLPYIPPAPGDVKVESVNETVVRVEWSPIRDSLITGYHITYQELDRVGRPVDEVQVDASQQRVNIPGLTHDTTYKIRVRAETSTEKGQYSAPHVITTLESDKPIALQTSAVTYNQAELTWYAPVEKREITGFRLVLTEEGRGTVRRDNIPGDLQHLLTDLYPDTKYTVTIRSIVGATRGKISDEFHFKTEPFVPKAPMNVQSVPVNDTAVRITWTPTLTDDTKGYLVLYNVIYSEVGEAREEAVQVAGEADTAVIASLAADTAYRVKVRAETMTEKGDYSLPTRVRTLKSDKPDNLRTTKVDYNYVDLSWSAPVDQRRITGFELFIYDVRTGEIIRENISPATRLTLRPLEPDRRYALTLKSLMDGVEGKTSDVLEFKTLPFVPDAPVGLNASPINDTAARITWTPTTTDENRRYVVRYHVDYRERVSKEKGDVSSGSVQVPGDIYSAVIVSLDADTKYRIRVRAETETEEGKYSQTTAVQTLKSDKPIRLKTSRIKFNEAVLSWYAPVRERNITMFYLVLTDVASGEITRRSIPSNLRHVLRALEPDRTYNVTLTSVIPGILGKTSDIHEFKTLPFVPKAPRNVKTAALNDTSVQVSWTPTVTDETRRYVTRYNIVYSKQGSYGSEEMSVQVPGSDVMGVITSLDADTSYMFRVRAETQTEQGEYTQPAVARTLVSDRPGSLQTTDIDFNEVKVVWYAPVKDRNITGFQLLLNDVATGETIPEQVPAVLEHTLTGLEPDRKYTLQVTPQLTKGIGKTSNVLEFQTAPYIPEAPTAVTATALHDTAVEIHWRPTVDSSNQRFIQRYKVVYLEEGGRPTTERSVEVGKDATTATIVSLAADTRYKIRVRAETKTEVGKYNPAVLVATLLSDKPKALSTTELKFNRADVSWYAPISERDITGFDLVLSDVTTGQVSRTTTPPTSRHSFTGLKPDRDYNLTVKSNLRDLEGKMSDVFEFRTLPYIPDPPADVSVTPLHDTGLSVQWRPTVDEETRQYVISYRISYKILNTDSTNSVVVGKNETSVDILSLTADTGYTVRVRAETDTEEGIYSQPAISKTLRSDKPTSLRITSIQFNQADVLWVAPVKQRNIVGFELALADATTRDIKLESVPPDTSYSFTGLKPDRDYTLTVKSVLEGLEGKTSDVFEFRTLPYIPDAPADVRVTPLHDTALLVTWTPTVNEETYEFINRYVITYNILKEVETTSPWVDKDSASFQIDKLSADTSYRIKVRAETPTEKGQYSEPVISKTLLSDKPMSLKINYLQFNQADVSWVAPVKQRNIVGFELKLGDATTRDIKQERVPPDTSYSFTGLKPDRDYTLAVKSVLEDLEGKTSDLLEFRTLPYIPDAPADVRVTPLHDTALLVTWTPTVNEETYEYINRYVISYNILYGVETTSPWVDKDSASFQIDKLSADTSYRIRVRAETPTEKGQYSEPVISKTLLSDKPMSLKINYLQFNQADVSWVAPVKQRNIVGFELKIGDATTRDIKQERVPPDTSYSFTGLKPDRDYTLAVKSVLEDLEGKTSDLLEFRTLPYIPDAPADVRVTPLHDTALLVTWTPTVNEETYEYINRYVISYNILNEVETTSPWVDKDSASFQIDKLSADTSYRIRVRAETPTEKGQYSEPVISKTLVSDRPQSLRTSGVHFNEVDIAWYAPINARNITSFRIELTDDATGEVTVRTTQPVSRYAVTGLEPDRKYSLTLTSVFGNEEGKTSQPLNFKTLPYIPKPPENVIAIPLSDTSVEVTWKPTVDDDTRSFITLYNIAYKRKGSRDNLFVKAPPDISRAVINNLKADTGYEVKVKAVTATHEGLFTQPVFFKSLQSDKPRSLKTFGLKFNQTDLSWFAPVLQRNITGFLLIAEDQVTGEVIQLDIPPKNRYTLTGLTAEHTYVLTITSMFGETEGKTSDALQFTTLPFVPEAPENVILTPINDSAILVEWTPPVTADTARYVVRYNIAYNKAGRSERVRDRLSIVSPGDSNMAVINDLEANTEYRVRIRAETKTQTGALSKAMVVKTLESDMPRGLKALNTEFDRAELSWYAPMKQRNITNFVVTLRDTLSREITQQVLPPKSRQTVSGLKAERKYELTVTSMLGEQEGKTSDVLELTTKPFVPGTVEGIMTTALNQSTILVQWQNPDDTASREYITFFRVEYGEMDRFRRVKNPLTKEHRGWVGQGYIPGLTEDTDYRIRVRAETDTQKGPYTRAYLTTTLMSEQPRQLRATSVDYSSISLAWEAPIEQRNITSFNVFSFDTTIGEETRFEIPPKLTFRLASLIPDRVYAVMVSAMIGVKEGEMSKPIEVKTDPFIPRAPTEVKSYPINATAVHVEWQAPDDIYAREYVIGFNILYDKARSKLPVEEWSLLEYYGHKENALIKNLEPDTEYNILVRVNTKTEKGALSGQINVKTMVSAEPMNLQTPRVSFDQFDVTWEAPVEERNISAFAVYLTESSNNGKTREEIGPIQKHSIDSLSPSSIYVVEVASILDSGEGILSEPLTVETMPFVPEAPTGVQATSYNFSSVTFRWKLPKDPASKTYIKGGHLLYTKNIKGHVTEQEVIPGQMEATILSSLEEDSTYRVQVRAFSDTAEGKLSRPIIISTPPKIPDWSPDLLTATVEYDRSVRLEWYVNSPKAALDRTLRYEVQYYRQPDPYGDMYVSDLETGPTIIDNLETHSTYSFRIRAYSHSGPGPWSSALETTLDGPDLGKIDILRINRTDPYSSKVRWVHIGQRSLAIEGFRVYYTPVDYKFDPMPGQRYINSVGPRLRFDQMRSLIPEQYYHVQVAAFSEDGIGKRSKVKFLPDMDYPRIAVGPRDKKVAAKLAVTFTCQITGVPDYKVYWKKGNVRLPRRHERFEYRMVNGSSVLRIKQAIPKDSAVYKCILNVNGTLYTKGASLEVYDQTEIPSGYPSFTRNPSLTSVETGSNTSFICAATGIPVPTIKWYKNNVPITESRKFVVTQIGRESRLWILNATLEDVGKYVCSAENKHGTISNFDAQLYVKLKKSAPVFIEIPEDVFALPGTEVNLTCVVEGEPQPTVRWLKDGAYMKAQQSDTNRDDLIIPEVYVSGEYTCEATNNQGQKSVSARIQIDGSSDFKGVVLREPTDKTVAYGSSVSLECEGAGNPKPNIFWEKDGKRLSREDFGKSYYLEEKEGVSMLGIGKVVGSRDQGVFACTVENSLGYSEAVAALTVLKKKNIPEEFPVITKRNVVTAVARGESTSLYCAANDPEAVITWYKDRFSITSTKEVTITTKDGGSKLLIIKAKDKHYGKYHCSAENKLGIAYSKPAMLYIRRTTRKKS